MWIVERYFAGECESVWAELNSGVDRFGAPISAEDAERIARETMRRVRRNIEILIPRLTEMGYEFGVFWWDRGRQKTPVPYFYGPHFPPVPADTQTIAFWEEFAGPIPLALRVFWEEVGCVDFCGILDRWPRCCHDPLVVWPVGVAFEDYETDKYSPTGEPPYTYWLRLSTDAVMKYSPCSGAYYYATNLPDPTPDPLMNCEPNRTTFVNYLRLAFEWGGFPGFKQLGYKEAPMEDINVLREGLISF